MTDHIPPPQPPAPRPNYILFGLGGVIIGLLIVVILLVATRDNDPAATTLAANPTVAAPTTEAETTSSAAPETTAAATTVAPFAGDTSNEVAAGDPFGIFNFLHDVRFQQREEGFTRVVFDFEDGDVPWWSVEYTAGPFSSIADEPIPVSGTAFLRVVLSSTTYDLSGAEVRITYQGPERIPANTNSVEEIVLIDDFEGVSSWVVGVDGIKPFTVGTLTDPPRVYIDIGD